MLNTGIRPERNGAIDMKAKSPGKLRDGVQCKVIGGVHAGQSGVVRDIKTGKTGHVSITVVQPNGERFKALAKNVFVQTVSNRDDG
jgi:ribosomal protein S4E